MKMFSTVFLVDLVLNILSNFGVSFLSKIMKSTRVRAFRVKLYLDKDYDKPYSVEMSSGYIESIILLRVTQPK